MSDRKEPDCINSGIWFEEAESNNPFAAAACYCYGFDVYGDILGKARWAEYIYLLFKGKKPDQIQAQLLEDLSIAIANPGVRDYSVRAAMSASSGGSTAASALMAALAVGAGQYNGSREAYLAVQNWSDCGHDMAAWQERLQSSPPISKLDIWPEMEHSPGFDPYGVTCSKPVKQTLEHLASIKVDGALSWLRSGQSELESFAGGPLTMIGVAAAALVDLGFDAHQAEMMFLLLRLPGAAVHALEQYMQWKHYPFFKQGVILKNDPGSTAE